MLPGKHLRTASGFSLKVAYPAPVINGFAGPMLHSPVMASQPQRPASLDEIKNVMASVNDLFSREVVGRRNFAALDEVYTADARILPPGAPMIAGREAIKKFWRDFIQSANAQSGVLNSVDVVPSGDGIVELGRALLTVAPPGQSTAQIEAKYVVYWRQEDGRWKWHWDIWNPNA
jgi:ketosteroid isomerase-like protein